MLNTPVAYFIFNRPDLTAVTFEAIAKAKPVKLLVVADGPRFPEEAEKCEQTRAIIKKVDWNCEVITNFSEINLGCKHRVASGLDWVFSQVEEAIILEDDCVPAPTFFKFCEELLERYRDDTRIMHIGGVNFQLGKARSDYSYYFSKYSHVWGWATWRRAWKLYDVNIQTWPTVKASNLFASLYENKAEEFYWVNIFDKVYLNQIDTWDYQWLYTCWSQNGLAIIPALNLITNIGFGEAATHTKSENLFANLPYNDITSITHPILVTKNKCADEFTFEKSFGGNRTKNNFTLNPKTHLYRIRKWILRVKFQYFSKINS